MENQPQADELIAQNTAVPGNDRARSSVYFERLEHAVRSEQKRAQESHLKRPLLCDAHQVAIADMGRFINHCEDASPLGWRLGSPMVSNAEVIGAPVHDGLLDFRVRQATG